MIILAQQRHLSTQRQKWDLLSKTKIIPSQPTNILRITATVTEALPMRISQNFVYLLNIILALQPINLMRPTHNSTLKDDLWAHWQIDQLGILLQTEGRAPNLSSVHQAFDIKVPGILSLYEPLTGDRSSHSWHSSQTLCHTSAKHSNRENLKLVLAQPMVLYRRF
jgi:hypothetical protein